MDREKVTIKVIVDKEWFRWTKLEDSTESIQKSITNILMDEIGGSTIKSLQVIKEDQE